MHVPYKGPAPATQDLIARQVQLLFDTVFSQPSNIRAGKLKALAISPLNLPAQHPLAAKPQMQLKQIAREPLVLCGEETGADRHTRIEAAILAASDSPNIVDYAENQQVLLALVGAGYGVGFVLAPHAEVIQRPDIMARPIASPPPFVKTFLLYRHG